MTRQEYVDMFPDPQLRTAISGCLGRIFWEIASDGIWAAWNEYLDYLRSEIDELDKFLQARSE